MAAEAQWLSVDEIERASDRLLADYQRTAGPVVRPPIPVEEVLENHLGFSLEFDDLRKRLGIPDVIGAAWLERREVAIDESLCPELHPSVTGRYRFTVGHEIAHWELHRQLILGQGSRRESAKELPDNPSIVCRSKQKSRIERQADLFSSRLLMPNEMVLDCWRENLGRDEPICYEDHTDHRLALGPNPDGPVRAGVVLRAHSSYFFKNIAKPFATIFQVSPLAMSIRLRELGVLRERRRS